MVGVTAMRDHVSGDHAERSFQDSGFNEHLENRAPELIL